MAKQPDGGCSVVAAVASATGIAGMIVQVAARYPTIADLCSKYRPADNLACVQIEMSRHSMEMLLYSAGSAIGAGLITVGIMKGIDYVNKHLSITEHDVVFDGQAYRTVIRTPATRRLDKCFGIEGTLGNSRANSDTIDADLEARARNLGYSDHVDIGDGLSYISLLVKRHGVFVGVPELAASREVYSASIDKCVREGLIKREIVNCRLYIVPTVKIAVIDEQ